MKCPFRKFVFKEYTGQNCVTHEQFEDCYEKDCPYYSGPTYCLKADYHINERIEKENA